MVELDKVTLRPDARVPRVARLTALAVLDTCEAAKLDTVGIGITDEIPPVQLKLPNTAT